MSDRLPPLTALRAFEAAARHMSFAKAASELNVTPAALSFQIKSLEEHFGAPLFNRLNRAVELTEAGRALTPGATSGFQQLQAAWREARRTQNNNILNVTAGPAFTAMWLAPRFFDFVRSHPDIDLRFNACLRIMDFDQDDIDVAIRFGYGPDEGLFSHPLSQEWLTPAMTPEMAQQYATPQALLSAPLIHNSSDDFLQPPCDWPAWFRAAGLGRQNPPLATQFSQPDHALNAALSGAGIVLARRTFVLPHINEGRLVSPFSTAISTRAHFRFVCRKGTENQPKIRTFLDWLRNALDDIRNIPPQYDITPVEDLHD